MQSAPLDARYRLTGANWPVQTIADLEMLHDCIKSIRGTAKSLALVPTMGALHDGHMALVDEAKRRADRVIVSIFVNPTQFGPNEDFSSYPRRTEADTAKLEAAGVDLLWLPDVGTMYPKGHATNVAVVGLSDRLCGAARPGHFDGVATVVTKLFAQIGPDIAIFGEKDWQQLAIIRRLVIDLNLPVSIAGVAIQREDDGLALSSRNAYLSPDERLAAVALPRALGAAVKAIMAGKPVEETLNQTAEHMQNAGFDKVDYVAFVDATTLEPLTMLDREARLLAAARIGKTRLIDNLAVLPG